MLIVLLVAITWAIILACVVGMCLAARAGDEAMLAAETQVPLDVRLADAASDQAPGRSVALMN